MASSGLPSPRAIPESYSSSSPRNRSHSIASDRPSTTGYNSMLSPPINVQPMPVYIAASAASQIVTNDHDSHSESWFDQHGIEPSQEAATVSPQALRLVNNFLDQLLFSFLAISKSTSLNALRPAVAEILKPKLAQEAINTADQELDEYLGGVEEDDTEDARANRDWDLELVWKRTRLRCMVYSSLGDMEEDDEDRYASMENLESSADDSDANVVSPAVAIFLTSILEFMGEQALIAAGQAAFTRMRVKQQKEEKDGSRVAKPVLDRVEVDDADMERVALDRTLGRLWRGWKKRIRTGNESISYSHNNMRNSYSRESMLSRNQSRRNSTRPDEAMLENEESPKSPTTAQAPAKPDQPEDIPLPIGDNDVNEIEVPGLAYYSDNDNEVDETLIVGKRPTSMMIFTSSKGLPTPTASQPSSPQIAIANSRKRSASLPSPALSMYSAPLKRQKSTADNLNIDAEGSTKSSSHSRNASEETKRQSKIVEVATTVAALGAAAVAGIAAVAKGEAPQTTPMHEEEIELDEDDDVEIMTSSRISIGSPLDLVSHSQPPSGKSSRSASVRSKRSGSVTSARIIDVPRSPAPKLDDTPPVPGLTRRVSSGLGTTPPAISESSQPRVAAVQVQRMSTIAPIIRVPSPLSRDTTPTTEYGSALQTPIVAVPERSPLREKLSPTSSPIDELSQSEAQFAKGINSSGNNFILGSAPSSRSSREVKPAPIAVANPQSIQRTSTTSSIVPPLTPLREMVENAPDTSDDASTYSDQSALSPNATATARQEYFKQPRKSSLQSLVNGRPSPRISEEQQPMRNEIANKSMQKLHTSGSSTSSIKSYRARPVRDSEDSMPSPKLGEGIGKNFDDLIRSETTLQYTLTPSSMRGPVSPITPAESKFGARPRTTSNNSISKTAGFYASEAADKMPSPTASRHSHKSNGSRVRNGPMARDARVENESIGDFADFIRSTGPPKGRDDFAVLPPTSHSNGSGPRSNMSAPRSVPIQTPMSSANRNRLQARDAIVHADGTSELIDFIRTSGPVGNSIEPRSTRLSTLAEVRDSVITTTSVAPSVQSSVGTINSNTALLSSHKKPVGAAAKSAAAPPLFSAFPEEEDMMPKKTRRRIRDPYAIDFSDEDDEDLFSDTPVPAAKPKRQEESLMDFLNSVPPPPPQQPQRFDLGPSSPPPKEKKKEGFMGRFKSGNKSSPDVSHQNGGTLKKTRSNASRPATSKSHHATPSGSIAPAVPPMPKHIPLNVNASDYPTYPPTPTQSGFNSAPPVGGKAAAMMGGGAGYGTDGHSYGANGNNTNANRPHVQQKSYQPREATQTRTTRTSDLADFLMNTPPPPQITVVRRPPTPEVEKKGWWGTRRKRGVV